MKKLVQVGVVALVAAVLSSYALAGNKNGSKMLHPVKNTDIMNSVKKKTEGKLNKLEVFADNLSKRMKLLIRGTNSSGQEESYAGHFTGKELIIVPASEGQKKILNHMRLGRSVH